MSWFWFIAFVLAMVYVIRLSVAQAKSNREQLAQLSAMIHVAKQGGMSNMQIAKAYTDLLGETLRHQDYDEFMSGLCKQHGLTFRSDDGYLISEEVQKQLVKRIAQELP